jgi:hypothetical protein
MKSSTCFARAARRLLDLRQAWAESGDGSTRSPQRDLRYRPSLARGDRSLGGWLRLRIHKRQFRGSDNLSVFEPDRYQYDFLRMTSSSLLRQAGDAYAR